MTDVRAAPCHYCGTPLDPFARTTYRMIVGWERKAGIRASGSHGGSDIHLREPRDRYACGGCIHRIKSGIAIQQETLI